MKKSLKFVFTILILTIMAYSPNVLANGVAEPGTSGGLSGGGSLFCGKDEITIEKDTTLGTGIIGAGACEKYQNNNNTATIKLIYKGDTNWKVNLDYYFLKAVKDGNLNLEIKATKISDESEKELYTVKLTNDELVLDEIPGSLYNVTVWLETLSDEQIASLEKLGYTGKAYLKAADENNNLNATYEINVDGILEDSEYWVIDDNVPTLKDTSLTVANKVLEIVDTDLFNSYIVENSKVVENNPAPAPSTGSSSSTSSSSSTNTTLPPTEIVEFKQEITSQSLSIPGSKYQDVIKDTIASDENLKEKLANGANVVIKSEPAPVNESSQDSFKAVVQGGNILNFVDIKINLQADNQDYPITNLKDRIELSLTIPPAPVVPSGYYREYYVLREHDGEIERLDSEVSEDGKTITFSSDKFSVYAVGYVDKKIVSSNVDNPNTGDNIYFIVSTFIISAIGLCLSTRKMLTNK